MATGLNHLHTSLAHLLVLFALTNTVLAVLGAGRKPSLAAIMTKVHAYGVMMLGRLIYVAGLGLAMVTGHSFAQPWIVGGLVLWGAVEVAGKLLVSAELATVSDGAAGSSTVALGAGTQLLVIVVIYGLMYVKPTF